jgi:lipopolysaccharide export LptBFGC system permease protein LptF
MAVEWHKKPATAASCVTLALVGLAVARAFRRRLVRVLAATVIIYLEYGLLRLGEQAADAGRLPPALAMWAPAILVLALAAPLPLLTRCRPARPAAS